MRMKQNVKLVFDRKKQVAETGSGKIELCIYLARREVKWETVGTSDLENWCTSIPIPNFQESTSTVASLRWCQTHR